MVGNDSVAYASINYESRRLTMETASGNVETPYYVTPTGIHLQTPITVNGQQLAELDFDATTNELADANAQGIKLAGFTPEKYKPIKFGEGAWQLVYATSGDANPQYGYYNMNLETYDASNLLATVNIDGIKYQLGRIQSALWFYRAILSLYYRPYGPILRSGVLWCQFQGRNRLFQ